MATMKKKIKDPKEIVEEIPEAFPSNSQKLYLNPDSLMGVASAYRYKMMVTNSELERAAFYFDDSLDIFAFNDVNKKRALKKQDWPTDAPLNHPRRYNVKVQLMAGNAEIKSCGGCSMWKDMTRKPFLVLTPFGTRCVEFSKNPFILLIFRCCPKFHSYTKQFSLRVTITHATFPDIVYCTEVIIHRKKMNNVVGGKKRKGSVIDEAEDFQEEENEECSFPDEKRCRHEAKEAFQNSCSPVSNFESIKYPDLDSVLALHETLFPNEARLLKPNAMENFTEVILSNPLSPSPAKLKGVKNLYSQPFQQYQEEYEWFNAHYEQGQQVPQQWGTPQQFFDFLFNKKPTPKPVLADPSANLQPALKKSSAPPLLEPNIPEISNDEKWLTTVLNDVPFSNDLFRFDDISLFPFETIN